RSSGRRGNRLLRVQGPGRVDGRRYREESREDRIPPAVGRAVQPLHAHGVVASGVLWGIMMGLVEVLITLRVEDLSLREGWKRVAMLEALTAILFAGE